MKRFFTIIFGCLLVWSMSATTFTFTDATFTKTQDGVTVSLAQASGLNAPAFNSGEVRLYANNTVTVTGAGITAISLTFAKQGSKPYATLTADCGTLTSGGSSTGKTDLKTDTWTGAVSQVVFTMGASGQRIITEITVTTDGSTPGVTPTDTTTTPTPSGLDPNYVYADPTTITVQGEAGSNQAYTFIQNNIQVTTTVGAIVLGTEQDYFGCNAGQSITFTASKPMKSLSVNGYVKKDFSATVSAGLVQFVDASEDAVEANPVLIVKDINSTSVTINCLKQMRCYNVTISFAANTTDSIGEGGDDLEYNYDFEPEEATTLNLVFDEIETLDMSEQLGYICSYIGLFNETHELELDIFAALEADGLPAAGTYPINDTYAEGTVMASPGGDDYMDYPSCIYTDYEEMDGELYYNTAYYLVSGSLEIAAVAEGKELRLNATTAHGSTVTCTFLASSTGSDCSQLGTSTFSTKTMQNGELIIRRGEHMFNVLGTKINP